MSGQSSVVPESIIVSAAGIVGATASGRASLLTAAQARTVLDVYATATVDALSTTVTDQGGAITALQSGKADKGTTLAGYGITDGQPLDDDLTAIAALATQAYGRSLLTLADQAAGRTSLGLGTMATEAASSYLALTGGTLTGPLSGTNATWSGVVTVAPKAGTTGAISIVSSVDATTGLSISSNFVGITRANAPVWGISSLGSVMYSNYGLGLSRSSAFAGAVVDGYFYSKSAGSAGWYSDGGGGVTPGAFTVGAFTAGAATFSGTVIVAGGTVTTSNPVASWTQTWNAGAVTFTGLKLNVTDTASAAGSLLVDLQVGGTSKWKVDKSGNATIGGTLDVTGAAWSPFTFATVPVASAHTGRTIRITDRNQRSATSDGTTWNWTGTTTAIT